MPQSQPLVSKDMGLLPFHVSLEPLSLLAMSTEALDNALYLTWKQTRVFGGMPIRVINPFPPVLVPGRWLGTFHCTWMAEASSVDPASMAFSVMDQRPEIRRKAYNHKLVRLGKVNNSNVTMAAPFLPLRS